MRRPRQGRKGVPSEAALESVAPDPQFCGGDRKQGIPKGFCLKAQGCEERATLGKAVREIGNPNGVVGSVRGESGRNPVGVVMVCAMFPKGSSFLATLGWRTQSFWDWRYIS